MITITTNAQDDDEARVVPDDGVLAIARTRRDINALLDICHQCRQRPQSTRTFVQARERWEPLRAFYAKLLLADGELSEEMARKSWLDDLRQNFLVRGGDDFDALALALSGLADGWSDEDDEAQVLYLAVAAPANRTREVEIVFRKPIATLVFRPGSLVADFSVEAGIKSVGWLLTVIAKGATIAGPAPQVAADQLIEDARKKAESSAKFPLTRLETLAEASRDGAFGSPLLIVFLHGLFATDLGTFDGFVDRLHNSNPLTLLSTIDSATGAGLKLEGRAKAFTEIRNNLQARVDSLEASHPEFSEAMRKGAKRDVLNSVVGSGIHLAGWPHNTLTAIDVNASQLADLLGKFLPQPPRMIFVCHSRGGLVARAAIVKLLASKGRERIWRKCLAGLITFGTPHDGASLAEQPLRNLATYFLLARSTGKIASLSKVLSYLQARSAEGIEQLKREQATTSERPVAFIEQLYSLERDLVRDQMGRRFPPAIAIGGALDDGDVASWSKSAFSSLATRWLATRNHDLVVELQSSISSRLDADITAVVHCDHFSYFKSEGPEHTLAADVALALVWSQLNFNEAFFTKVSHAIHVKKLRRTKTLPGRRGGVG